MLEIKCGEHFERVKAWAREQGLGDRLQKTLDYLADYGQQETRCLVFTDFAPHSFQVTMQRADKDGGWCDWWHGGCIYNKNDGNWSVHT